MSLPSLPSLRPDDAGADALELVGRQAQALLTVGPADTAVALGSGDVAVLGTPRLIALCEEATCAAVRGAVPDDHTTVGIEVAVRHLLPSWPGDVVRADARVVAADARRIEFAVVVRSADREPEDSPEGPQAGHRVAKPHVLAEGTVIRAIVARGRFTR